MSDYVCIRLCVPAGIVISAISWNSHTQFSESPFGTPQHNAASFFNDV